MSYTPKDTIAQLQENANMGDADNSSSVVGNADAQLQENANMGDADDSSSVVGNANAQLQENANMGDADDSSSVVGNADDVNEDDIYADDVDDTYSAREYIGHLTGDHCFEQSEAEYTVMLASIFYRFSNGEIDIAVLNHNITGEVAKTFCYRTDTILSRFLDMGKKQPPIELLAGILKFLELGNSLFDRYKRPTQDAFLESSIIQVLARSSALSDEIKVQLWNEIAARGYISVNLPISMYADMMIAFMFFSKTKYRVYRTLEHFCESIHIRIEDALDDVSLLKSKISPLVEREQARLKYKERELSAYNKKLSAAVMSLNRYGLDEVAMFIKSKITDNDTRAQLEEHLSKNAENPAKKCRR